MDYRKYSIIALLLLSVISTTMAITLIGHRERTFKDSRQQKPIYQKDTLPGYTDDDAWKEFENIVSVFYYKKGVAYQGIVKLIDNSAEQKIINKQSFELTLFNNEYLYKLRQVDIISKKDFLLAVDYKNRTISFSRILRQIPKAELFHPHVFLKILKEHKAYLRASRLGNEKIITISHTRDPFVQGFRIYYSPITYQIRKIELGMIRRNLPIVNDDLIDTTSAGSSEVQDSIALQEEIVDFSYYLEVNFSTINLLHLKRGQFTPEKQFARITPNSIQLAVAYSQYKLIDSD